MSIRDSACGPVRYVSGDTDNDYTINVNEVWTFSCTTNLSRTTTDIAQVTGSANGLVANTTAQATVTVGAPVVTPAGASQTTYSSGLSSAQIQAILSLLTSFGADSSIIASVQASLLGTGTSPSPVGFTRNLKTGMTGEEVRQLQRFLNARGFAVALTGAGSPGQETDYFGPATRSALAKFQAAHGIAPAAGYFGPKTRDFITTLTP